MTILAATALLSSFRFGLHLCLLRHVRVLCVVVFLNKKIEADLHRLVLFKSGLLELLNLDLDGGKKGGLEATVSHERGDEEVRHEHLALWHDPARV